MRQQRFVEVLDGYGITHLEHTMVCDVVKSDGRVVGAVALHVPSGEIITVTCKAAILCAGSGTVKPAGYPLGGAAFDGTYIAYKHGLPVAGMEFEDYHLAWSEKPDCVLTTSGWDYSEPFSARASGWTAETTDEEMVNGGYLQKINYQYATAGLATPDKTHYGAKHTPTTGWNAPGAAPGFPLHMTGGVFCGWDDTCGASALPGLYGAGDGSLGSFIGGACYYGISGLTTSSRGFHYRADFPYRDDQYLGVFTATKADDGMRIDFVQMPPEWVGDTEAAYEVRYPGYRFYGEAAAKGLPEESAGW